MHQHADHGKLRLLFGTNNPAKIEILKAFLETLPIELLSPADLDLHVYVREDGRSPGENAAKKARAYFTAAQIPTFAIDAALSIPGLPPKKQPGLYVRRLHKTDQEATDREILDYYINELRQVGGTSPAIWDIALAFTASDEQVIVRSYALRARLVSEASRKMLPGAPLSSLMIDEKTGKYLSETDHRERPDAPWVKAIMRENLERLGALK